MLFNSFAFLYLLFITFFLYYIPQLRRFQVAILIAASLVFYAYDQLPLVLLLLFSATINITTSYLVAYGRGNKRTIALLGVIINLAALAFFKYSTLFARTFLDTDDSIGRFLLNIPLPIGISFFTFEGISLLVDVWKEKYVDNRQLIPPSILQHARNTLFFISFFPHLVAGPILKAHEFYPQIHAKLFPDIDWLSAFRSLTTGYFLKMVIADNLKNFTFWIEYPYSESLSTLTLLALLLGYSFQIFADFAGYSLIAIGLAKLFGYNFNENFNFPYIATSFKEFWKRWHISLSTFLMEYLYFALGGNRKGKARTYVNLMITMFLGGLWHGAAWSYAVWGTVHGLALAVERWISDNIRMKSNVAIDIVKGLFVFAFVTFAWLLFKLPNFDHVIKFFEALARNVSVRNDSRLIVSVMMYSLPVIVYHLLYVYRNSAAISVVRTFQYIPYAVMIFLIVTNSGIPGTFIYFQF